MITSAWIETHESGFELWIEDDEQDGAACYPMRAEAADELYASVRSTIGEWIAEREEARRTAPVASYDPSEAYDPTNPKHPGYYDGITLSWEWREGK